jgi:hypothetical protein
MGVSKYSQYGMVYPLDGIEPVPQKEIQDLRGIVEDFWLKKVTGKI